MSPSPAPAYAVSIGNGSISHHDAETSSKAPQPRPRNQRNVVFNQMVKIVLIPTRFEFAAAGLQLWWGSSDYWGFQQAAISELRLHAACHNCSLKEARSRIYQPTEEDLRDDAALSSSGGGGASGGDDGDVDDDEDYFSYMPDAGADEDDECAGTHGEETKEEREDFSSHNVHALYKVSSLECMGHSGSSSSGCSGGGSSSGGETSAAAVGRLFPKSSSLDCLAMDRDSKTDDAAERDTLLPSATGGAFPTDAAASVDADDAALQLCVPLDVPATLANVPNVSSWRRKRWGLGFKRRGGSTFCPATIALYSAALLVAFVVFDRYASV